MKMCAGSFRYVVVRRRRVWCIAINSALSMFWSPCSLYVTLRCLKGLYIPYPAFSVFQYPQVISLGSLHLSGILEDL